MNVLVGHAILSKYHERDGKESPIAVCSIENSLCFLFVKVVNGGTNSKVRQTAGNAATKARHT
jgi:hypothetical protein